MKLAKPAIVNTKNVTLSSARSTNKTHKSNFAAGKIDASKAVPAHQKNANLKDSRSSNLACKDCFAG